MMSFSFLVYAVITGTVRYCTKHQLKIRLLINIKYDCQSWARSFIFDGALSLLRNFLEDCCAIAPALLFAKNRGAHFYLRSCAPSQIFTIKTVKNVMYCVNNDVRINFSGKCYQIIYTQKYILHTTLS